MHVLEISSFVRAGAIIRSIIVTEPTDAQTHIVHSGQGGG
jgi:hypothetical protein